MEETLFSSPFSFVLEENRNFLFLSVSLPLSVSLNSLCVLYPTFSAVCVFKDKPFSPISKATKAHGDSSSCTLNGRGGVTSRGPADPGPAKSPLRKCCQTSLNLIPKKCGQGETIGHEHGIQDTLLSLLAPADENSYRVGRGLDDIASRAAPDRVASMLWAVLTAAKAYGGQP